MIRRLLRAVGHGLLSRANAASIKLASYTWSAVPLVVRDLSEGPRTVIASIQPDLSLSGWRAAVIWTTGDHSTIDHHEHALPDVLFPSMADAMRWVDMLVASEPWRDEQECACSDQDTLDRINAHVDQTLSLLPEEAL